MKINMITGLLLLLTDLLGYLLLTINTLWCVDCVCVACVFFKDPRSTYVLAFSETIFGN